MNTSSPKWIRQTVLEGNRRTSVVFLTGDIPIARKPKVLQMNRAVNLPKQYSQGLTSN